MKRAKVQLLVDSKWEHFSYVPYEIVQRIGGLEKLRYFITHVWCKKYGIRHLDTQRKMRLLRSRIRTEYKQKYADLYSETDNDSQGWVRWWITEKVNAEVSKNES